MKTLVVGEQIKMTEKEIIASHISPRTGTRFIIYDDGSHTMFTEPLRDWQDTFTPNELIFNYFMRQIFLDSIRRTD